MLSEFGRGFSYAWSGLTALRTPGLRRFVAVPLSINVLVFASLIVLGVRGFAGLIDKLTAFLPAWLDWLQWLLWPLFGLAVLLISVYTFTVFANLLAAPFNGLLSERFEKLLEPGAESAAAERPFAREILRALRHELGKLVYLLRWLLPLALMFLIPGINVLAPAAWLVFGAWLLTLEYMDYPMDNHRIPAAEQRRRLRSQRWLALGFGAGVTLMTSVPVLNFLAMPAAVLGATRLWTGEIRAGAATR